MSIASARVYDMSARVSVRVYNMSVRVYNMSVHVYDMSVRVYNMSVRVYDMSLRQVLPVANNTIFYSNYLPRANIIAVVNSALLRRCFPWHQAKVFVL